MSGCLPRHVSIIMDGNGRWAKMRYLPRIAGHRAGVNAVREVVTACVQKKIDVLSIFAFSSENWQRPVNEVSRLMLLFLTVLGREADRLHKQNVCIRFVGDRSRFDTRLQEKIAAAERLTVNNTGLKFVIAANYGGRMDIVFAARAIATEVRDGRLDIEDISPELFASHLALSDLPEPDLLIRTSGEQRISNFFLWQQAYTELYFSPVLWPDFGVADLEKAFEFYLGRERRFGRASPSILSHQAAEVVDVGVPGTET